MRDSNSSPPETPAIHPPATSVSKRCAACGEIYDATQAHLCQEDPTEGLKTLEAALPPPSTWLGPRPGEPEDLVGATLGDRYEMISRLSAGGMGVVYKARHKILNSIVAVKILLKHEDESDQQRFLQEAQLASKINHPNIVYISDYGVLTDGRPYLVMEFLEGPTVNSVLRKAKKHRIDMLRACKIAAQIARGMQSVHDKGIVHRDPNIKTMLRR